MPVTAKERARIARHAPSETVQGDMMYFNPGRFSISTAIVDGARRFSRKAPYVLLGIPDALMVVVVAYALAQLIRFVKTGAPVFPGTPWIASIPLLLLSFFVYFTFISAPIGSYYKSRLSGIEYSGVIKSMASSLTVLQPIGYTLMLALIAIMAEINALGWLSATVALLSIVFYFISINQSMLPQFLADTGGSRSNAVSHGWLLLSNSSLKVVSVNLVIFSPLIVLLAAFFLYQNMYVLAAAFPVFLISEGVWYCATASIHDAVVKGTNTYKIY